MPYFQQRLDIIAAIKEAAERDIQSRPEMHTNQTPKYLSINEFNQVKSGNISIVTGASVKYLFAFAGVGYKSNTYWKTTYEKILLLNSENEPLEKIRLKNWSLDIAFNIFDPQGYNSPNAILSINAEPSQTIDYPVLKFSEFQQAWDFFIEIDKNCTTIESAKIYKDFYQERLKTDRLGKKYEDLLLDIEKERDLNARYKNLIERIEEAAKVNQQ